MVSDVFARLLPVSQGQHSIGRILANGYCYLRNMLLESLGLEPSRPCDATGWEEDNREKWEGQGVAWEEVGKGCAQ